MALPERRCPECKTTLEPKAEACHRCGFRPRAAKKGGAKMQSDPLGLTGKVIDRKYQVLELLGQGGMGVVYKVRHLMLQSRNLFALKILHPRFSGDEEFRRRFLREVEVAMQLVHENIVQIRDFGVSREGYLFFTMDYVPGRPLKEVLRREGPLDPERTIAIARQILLALHEAHQAGVVHRDLKPDNVLLTQEGDRERVHVLDFGIAKLIEGGDDGRTLTQGVIGTPQYMSPEQVSGERVDARSDLYSLGVVLYEMLCGRAPFTQGTARQIVYQHLTATPPSLDEVRPDLQIPPHLERLVARLLEKDRELRPSSAAECLEILEGRGAETTAPGVDLPVARRKVRPGLVAGVGIAAGACVLGAVLLWFAFVPGRGLAERSQAVAPAPEIAEAVPPGPERVEAPESEAGGRRPPEGARESEAAEEEDALGGAEPREGARPETAAQAPSSTWRGWCPVCGRTFTEADLPAPWHHSEPLILLNRND